MWRHSVVLGLASVFLSLASPARAEIITTPSVLGTVIDFEQFSGIGYNFTFGPVQIGSPVGLDVTFTANPAGGGNSGSGSLLGSGSYGLAENGEWGGNNGFAGLDSTSGSMTFAFNFGLVSAVGGLVNYAGGTSGDATIEALDMSGKVLESYRLGIVAPVSTPGGFNAGAFRGIRRATADIAAFRVSQQYSVLDNLTFDASPAPVPEPGTISMVAGGALGIAARRWRGRRNRVKLAG